ncbi:MAG: histidine triad nucleotide-binding protein [Eubacteriales bacterium]|nr:histidine triad nucleotide-binding protein [Eubacteriales bacterium]
MDCLFCKIVAGEIPSTKVYEDDYTYAFRDINLQAPVHVLVVPRQHVANVLEGAQVDGLMQHMADTVAQVVRLEGLEKNGFRVIMNTGEDAMQTVKHLHMHVLGGRKLGIEMG